MKDIYIAQRAVMRRIRKSNARKKKIRKNKTLHTVKVTKKKTQYRLPYYKSLRYTYGLPSVFSLLTNTEETINAINQILSISRNKDCGSIYIRMENVKDLDIGALALLLSVVNSFRRQISVWGNMPEKEDVAEFFKDSGFLDHMTDLQGRRFEKKKNNPNLMIERGFDKTSNKQVGEIIKKVVNYLTGVETPYQPVYSITQEMCANSIEHANISKIEKNWLFTVLYAKEKVIFTMTDVGSGILTTLKKKKNQEFFDRIKQKEEIDVLYDAFEKKYLSSSLDKNRNKGLPKIKNTNQSGYVENLKVLTNNVLLDFSKNDNSTKIKSKLHGTFYYWELTKKSIETWKNREK